MRWPAERFEAFFDAWIRRRRVEKLDQRKNEIIASLHANSNADPKALPEVLEKMEEDYNHQVMLIYNPKLRELEEKSLAEVSPFFGAIKDPLKGVDHYGGAKTVIDENVDSIDWSQVEVDQL